MIPFSDIYSLIMPNIVSSFLILLTFFILALVLTFRNTKRIYNPLNTIKNTLSEEAPVLMGQNILDDINILAKSTKERLNKILAENTGKTIEEIFVDTERDNWLTAEQAVEYGLADKIIEKR